MSVRNFSMLFGIVVLIIGILGLFPAMIRPTMDVSNLSIHAGSGYLLGIFPVNLLHSFVHIIIGVWGLIAMGSALASKRYAVAMVCVFGVLAVMGLIPALNTLFTLAPIHGNDIWLHALLAVSAAYVVFFARDSDVSVRHV